MVGGYVALIRRRSMGVIASRRPERSAPERQAKDERRAKEREVEGAAKQSPGWRGQDVGSFACQPGDGFGPLHQAHASPGSGGLAMTERLCVLVTLRPNPSPQD